MIIFDLDGTLCDITHRQPLVQGVSRQNWDAFFSACVYDSPKPNILDVMRSLHIAKRTIQVWSGRSELVRAETVDWFIRHAPWFPHEEIPILMRPIGNYVPDEQLKHTWLLMTLNDGNVVDLVFDDRQKVVDMWRANGITCAQVAPGDF